MRQLNTFAMILFPVALLAACSENTSSTNQLITCDTEPGTGVILSCVPGGGGEGDDDPNTCVDVDENGDGEPSDLPPGTIASGGSDDDVNDSDDDDDGIDDEDDCDEQDGEDGDDDSEVDLPYDVRPLFGDTTTPIADAFAEKGAQPAAIVSVVMDGGGSWRLTELQAGASFVVTQADCDHQGNRDVGRDRVIVTWMNLDGSTESDHLDIRYCTP